MSHALLSDVEARAERRRTRTSADMWEELARAAWERGQAAQAAGDLAEARRWLERARRLAPEDGQVRFSLASLLLASGAHREAAALFLDLATSWDRPESWTALAACALRTDDLDIARRAAEAALRTGVPTPATQAIAAAVCARLGLPGWCGLDSDGRVRAGPGRAVRIELDGVAVRSRLPPGWRSAARLAVAGAGGALLGSPIPVARIAGVEGFVEAQAGGLSGWAWHPADPGKIPTILVRGPRGAVTLRPQAMAERAPGEDPLARPRRIALDAAAMAALGHPVEVTDAAGRPLTGSPLDPGLETRAAAGDDAAFAPVWVDVRGAAPAVAARRPPVDVVIPVYRGTAETLACLDTVLGSVGADTVVHVVDDASPEPELVSALERLAAAGRIRLHRLPQNRGFPAAANAGLAACAGRDVVLLNSDTLVAPGWLGRLRAAAYAAPDIGTVTPLSNDATIVSYPAHDGGNAVPDLAETIRLDRLAQCASPGQVAELPVGVGFCLYLRRDCLDATGPFRTDLFAQGYGEENDLCLRARQRGWRNVAALDVFVAHCGGVSFRSARAHLVRRNTAILNRLHPGYDALVADHLGADPLHAARRAMDALRWAEGRGAAGAVLLVTHGGGGGVDQVIAARAAAAQAAGLRPVVLRPAPGGCRIEGFPNLRYAIPEELPALAELLRADRPLHLEWHHLLGHDAAILRLADRLGVPVQAWVHDYSSFCPRIALVSRSHRYCGEPDLAGCADCIADLGSLLEEEIPVGALVARSAAELAACRAIVVPSRDAAARIRRHFPQVAPTVLPWEDDRAIPPPPPPVPPTGARLRVCVVGAIGREKGFDVLLDCVRDAARRHLPLDFVVCGFTADDARLLAAGPVFITGQYQDRDAVALIRAQAAQLAFLPSVWPETWCFALTRAWQAGLRVAAFDLGAQAERIAATGWGWTLPLGLPAGAINDGLLRLAPPPAASQCPRAHATSNREP